jgi:hypothetical protein
MLRTLANPLLLYERSESFFAECMGDRGCVIGAFAEDGLIGYAAGRVPGAGQENYGRDVALRLEQLDHVAHLSAGIHERFQGNRLHTDLVELRSALLHSEGYVHQCGEIVPSNVRSMRTLFANGYFLKGFRMDDFRFDPLGSPHFIIHRDTTSDPRMIDGTAAQEAPPDDIATYRDMLAAGLWGYRLRAVEGGYLLGYGKFVP